MLDFDGVLAPIVADPTTSAMPDRVATSLARLAGGLGLVAVISGRPVGFLEERVKRRGCRCWVLRDGAVLGWRAADRAGGRGVVGPVREAGRMLRELLAGLPGIRVEEKSVSVAVHWRQAPDRDSAADQVRRATARVV